MITFTAPLWFVAGALLALLPIVLHLIAPRPPARAPLPTARFLEPEARARRHLARRPRDPLLLVLRCLFLLLLAGALAGPHIVPPRSGTADVVLLDAAVPFQDAVDALRARLGERVVWVAFDTVARIVDSPADVTRAARSDYAVALDALTGAVTAATAADTLRAWLVTALRWGAWSHGLTSLRRSGWPGSITLVEITQPEAPSDATSAPGSAVIRADTLRAAALRAALAALGYDVRVEPAADALTIRVGGTTLETVPAGTRAVPPLVAGDIVMPDAAGSVVAGDEGDPVAAWGDGAPAAVARPETAGCRVVTGVDLAAYATTSSADFPALIDHLVHACSPPADPADALPLDAGARALLVSADGENRVAVAALPGGPRGRPVARVLLLAALAVALIETLITRRRDRGTSIRAAGTSSP